MSAKPRRHFVSSRLLVAGGILCAAATAYFAWRWTSGDGSHRDSAAASSSRAGLPPVTVVEAEKIVGEFLRAGDVDRRAAVVLASDYFHPIMESYYAGREFDPMMASEFAEAPFSTSPEGAPSKFLQFQRGRGLPPVIACVAATAKGPRLDWDIWTQTHDCRFQEFTRQPIDGTARLRVRMTGAGDSVTIADAFHDSGEIKIPLVDDPRLHTAYKRELPVGSSRPATVIIAWNRYSSTGSPVIEIRQHVSWGFDGIDDVPLQLPPETDPTATAEAQKVTSINGRVVSEAAAAAAGTPSASAPLTASPVGEAGSAAKVSSARKAL